jgi:hypothetical protein
MRQMPFKVHSRFFPEDIGWKEPSGKAAGKVVARLHVNANVVMVATDEVLEAGDKIVLDRHGGVRRADPGDFPIGVAMERTWLEDGSVFAEDEMLEGANFPG